MNSQEAWLQYQLTDVKTPDAAAEALARYRQIVKQEFFAYQITKL